MLEDQGDDRLGQTEQPHRRRMIRHNRQAQPLAQRRLELAQPHVGMVNGLARGVGRMATG